MRMDDNTARRSLLLIWWISLVLNIGSMVFLYAGEEIDWEEFWPAMQRINTLYMPYLGVITVYFWSAGKPRARSGRSGASRTGAWLAIACSLLWNVMILLFTLRLLFLVGTIEDSMEAADKLGGIFVWLVAPALGYYFAKAEAA